MCGLVGLVYKPQNGMFKGNVDAFTDMLYMDALRGDDSTGVAAYYTDGKMQVVKEAVTPVAHFLVDKNWQEVNDNLIKNGKVVIGHNRKATKGSISDENAHPWIIDNRYAFVHNGTISNHHSLYNTEVDSEALGMALTRCEGDPKAIEEVLSKVYGAYACIWIDKDKEKMYAVRNKERPLWLAETTTEIFLCSELGFILAASLRNNKKVEGSPKQLEEHVLYTFDLSKYTEKPEETKLEIKKSTPILTKVSHKNGQSTYMGATSGTKGTGWHILFSESASRKSAKKFKYKYGGDCIAFWCDTAYPDGSKNGPEFKFIIEGQSDLLEHTEHIICGVVSPLPKGGIKDKLCTADILDCEYDNNGDRLIIYVGNIEVNTYYQKLFDKDETTTTQH